MDARNGLDIQSKFFHKQQTPGEGFPNILSNLILGYFQQCCQYEKGTRGLFVQLQVSIPRIEMNYYVQKMGQVGGAV